jgi:tRNA A37 threonylcarbamoyladenosine modification protein TsaB
MLYLGLYDESARKLEGPVLVTPDDAVPLLPANLRAAAGNGAQLLAEAGARQGREIDAKLPELQPSAGALAEIALESGEVSPTLRPLYLLPPDARPQAPAVLRR